MKAVAVFPRSREVNVIEQEDPRISRPDQVMLRMPGIAPVGLLGTVNAGTDAFASALRNLDLFRRRWPAVVATLIAGRYPPAKAADLIPGRPAGIKTVIAFNAP